MAEMHEVTVMPYAFKTNIRMAAILQHIVSLPEAWYLEFFEQDTPLRRKLTDLVFEADRDGFVEIPQKPGIGVKIDWDVLNYCRAV